MEESVAAIVAYARSSTYSDLVTDSPHRHAIVVGYVGDVCGMDASAPLKQGSVFWGGNTLSSLLLERKE